MACLSTAEPSLLSDFSTAKARISEGDVSCISVAVELTPCLSAVNPSSKLTTMEEADCCTTLLVFKEAGCYCLAPESIQELSKADRCALGRRLNELAEANRRCGWDAISCPMPDLALSAGERDGGAAMGNNNLEADVARFYGQPEARKSQGRRVHGGSNQPVKSPKLELGAFAVVQQKQGEKQQTDVEKRGALLDQMTTYLNKVIKLTEALSLDRGDEVDLTIEVTMGATNVAASSAGKNAAVQDSSEHANPFWVWVVGFIVAMMVIAGMGLTLNPIAGMLSNSQECGQVPRRRPIPTPPWSTGGGVVVAADEVHSLRKLIG